MTDVLIVNPVVHPFNEGYSAIEPPVWAGMYAQQARKLGKTVAIHDCQERKLDLQEYDPKEVWVIVMGANPSCSSTPKMPAAINLCRGIKELGIKVALGGLHPQALPELTLAETGADYILPLLVCERGLSVAWDLLPMPIYRAHNWHCLDRLDDRSHYAALYTSFGCPYQCYYCNIRQLYGVGKWVTRPITDIVAELTMLRDRYGVRNLKLCDELFTVQKSRVKEICHQIKDFGFNIWAYASVNTVEESMLKQMKEAGINWLVYGFETFFSLVRQMGNKYYNDEERTIAMTRDAGINIMANFIFGLPGDTIGSMKRTLERAMQYNFEYVNFYVAMPYPGSQWFKSLEKPCLDWTRYGQFSSNPCADSEVVKFRDDAFYEYFYRSEYLSMIRRKFGNQADKHIKEMLQCQVRQSAKSTVKV